MKDRCGLHWPTILLGIVVASILVISVFSYQLTQIECAIVTTLGTPVAVTEPGLHFRWPFPFQKVYRFDRRIRCFEGGLGKLEETLTRDQHNILVSIYANYRISDVEKFFVTFGDMTNAEEQLNFRMRGFKNAAFGQYDFGQIISTDAKKVMIDKIQTAILGNLRDDMAKYGIEIVDVGITAINVPQSVSEKVFARMIAERKRIADKNIAEGESEARQIRIKADSDRTIALAEAEAEAQKIRAAGDAQAAQYYSKFNENPELASYLRQLESLRKTLKGKTTLVLDTNTIPFTLLKSGTDLKPNASKTK